MSDKMSFGEAVAVLFLLFSGFISTLYVGPILWSWYVVPLGVGSLTWRGFAGLILVLGLLRRNDTSEKEDGKYLSRATTYALLPWFSLFFGWVFLP